MGRITVEECCSLDVRVFQRMGIFAAPVEGDKLYPYRWVNKHTGKETASVQLGYILDKAGAGWLLVVYQSKQTGQPDSEYKQQVIKIPLLYTDMPHGGRRRWLACPDCGQRCAVLYIMLRGYNCTPACRRCLDLAYMVQYQRAPRIPKSWAGILDDDTIDDVQDVLNYSAFNRLLAGTKWVQRAMVQQLNEARAARLLNYGGLGLQAGDDKPAPPPVEVKRGRGRPKTKRAYTRRSLVTAAADVVQPCCTHCGQPLPLDTGRAAAPAGAGAALDAGAEKRA